MTYEIDKAVDTFCHYFEQSGAFDNCPDHHQLCRDEVESALKVLVKAASDKAKQELYQSLVESGVVQFDRRTQDRETYWDSAGCGACTD